MSGLKIAPSLPVRPYYLGLYVAYLSENGYAPSTIKTVVSAIGWFHRMPNLDDPSLAPAIARMIQGTKQGPTSPLKRDPITRSLLHKMIDRVDLLFTSNYESKQVKALLLLGYHACARAGELVLSSNTDHTIKLDNVTFVQSSTNLSLIFILDSYKHSKEKVEFELRQADTPIYCPVKHLLDYLALRGTAPGFLFINALGAPMKREYLAKIIKSLLRL